MKKLVLGILFLLFTNSTLNADTSFLSLFNNKAHIYRVLDLPNNSMAKSTNPNYGYLDICYRYRTVSIIFAPIFDFNREFVVCSQDGQTFFRFSELEFNNLIFNSLGESGQEYISIELQDFQTKFWLASWIVWVLIIFVILIIVGIFVEPKEKNNKVDLEK